MPATPAIHKSSLLSSCVLWLCMVVIYFAPVFFTGKMLAPLDIMDCVVAPYATQPMENVCNHFVVDVVSQYLPYSYSVAQSFEQDGYIGWNPYAHNGTPISENTMLSPGDWHQTLFAFLPFWIAWNTGIILQFFIAGLGVIIFLRSRGYKTLYCLLGAAGYAFYSQFVMWCGFHWMLGSMCWGGWILWALLRNKDRQDKRFIDPLSIIFIALGFRGGHLQACLFVFLLVVCVWLADWWQSPNRWRLRTIWLCTAPYWISGLGAAVLSLDVFMQTIPVLIHGCKSLGVALGIIHFPTMITAIFPTLLGIPATVDMSKFLCSDLLDLKYTGAILFILALCGLFNKRAPIYAKFLMVGSLIVAFSPLISWFYTRSTVVYALGVCWLACWQLRDFVQHAQDFRWKRIFIPLGVWTGCWLIGSIFIYYFRQDIITLAQEYMHAFLSVVHTGREAWYQLRIERFVDQAMLWHPQTFAFTALLWAGLVCIARLRPASPYNKYLLLGVLLCSFCDHLLFRNTRISFAEQPTESGLYDETEWITRLKHHVGDGAMIYVSSKPDKDYLPHNYLSAFGIRQANGYETVQPRRLHPLQNPIRSPQEAAKAGISHAIVNPRHALPDLGEWIFVESCPQYVLFANPFYQGRAFAHVANQSIPVSLEQRTCNTMQFTVPPGTDRLDVLETYSPGWTARLDNGDSIPVTCSERYGIIVPIEPGDTPVHVFLRYRDHRQNLYYCIMGGFLLFLGGLTVYRKIHKPV